MTEENHGPLASFLQKKYVEWVVKIGQVKKQSEFAAFLGIDANLLNRYLHGKRRNIDRETADHLAEKLGNEIYDVVGYMTPRQQALMDAIRSLDEDEQIEMEAYLDRLREKRRAALVQRARPAVKPSK